MDELLKVLEEFLAVVGVAEEREVEGAEDALLAERWAVDELGGGVGGELLMWVLLVGILRLVGIWLKLVAFSDRLVVAVVD